jgi:hypothetical protein
MTVSYIALSFQIVFLGPTGEDNFTDRITAQTVARFQH